MKITIEGSTITVEGDRYDDETKTRAPALVRFTADALLNLGLPSALGRAFCVDDQQTGSLSFRDLGFKVKCTLPRSPSAVRTWTRPGTTP